MMQLRFAFCVLITGAAAFISPSVAEACSCAGTLSVSAAAKQADMVFVAIVASVEGGITSRDQINADGSISVTMSTAPWVTTFDVARMYRGDQARQMVIAGDGTTCDHLFKKGEAWLVYARTRDGRVTTDKCTRTRLQAEAPSDLAYLEGLAQNRPQGVLHGLVLRRIASDRQPAFQSPFEPLKVIAVSAGQRTEFTTDKWGPYQLVLPPGDYEVWVERAGLAVAQRQAIHVADGSDRQLNLVVEYEK